MPMLAVDVQELSWFAVALSDDRLAFDMGRSVSAGALVFTTEADVRSGGEVVPARTIGGLITVNTWETRGRFEDVFAHERVHVVQVDLLKTLIGYPLEGWVARLVGADRVPVLRALLPGVAHLGPQHLLSGRWDRPADFFEVEAETLTAR